MRKRRGHKQGGHGSGNSGQERWLITYADLITLLMIFFVIMYAMSKIDATKFLSLSQSLASALHQTDNQIPLNNMGATGLVLPANPSNQGDKPKDNTNQFQTQQDKQLDNLYAQIKTYIDEHHLNGNVSILNETRGIQITLRDVVLFDTGQAEIKPQAVNVLQGLVPFLKTVDNNIVIEGYTDNVPISTGQYPSNWELSAARAIGVVRFLASEQVNPDRLSGVGYGEYHPVVANDSDAHRAENRRVNIVILRKLPSQLMNPDNNSAIPIQSANTVREVGGGNPSTPTANGTTP